MTQTHAPARHRTQKPTILRQGTYLADLAGHQMLPLKPRSVDSQHQSAATSNLHNASFTSISIWLRLQRKSQLAQGTRMGLVYRKGEVLDFLAALYEYLLRGMTAVPVNVIAQLEDMIQLMPETQMDL
ncbi:hypothetical protein BGZ93_009538, partial [Podila epicladia]